jgi:uncharacterized protein (DUF2336 family)
VDNFAFKFRLTPIAHDWKAKRVEGARVSRERYEEFWQVLRAAEGPAWTERAKAAGKLASSYCEGALYTTQRAAAEHVFRLLAADGETIVRRVLAESLKAAPQLPRDIALQLATDRPEVASPMLTHSGALSPDDLIGVIRDYPGEHRAAVARRLSLAAEVVEALCRCTEEKAVRALLDNERAEIDDEILAWIAEERPHWAAVRDALARRRPVRFAAAC